MRGRGFTLIEMLVVVAVLGVLFTILIGITRAVVSQQRYQLTRARMANVDTAIGVYVSQYKRLPCPADGTKASSVATAGTEVVTGVGTGRDCGTQINGVVPWRDLGLTATDIEDGWGGRLTFRVGPDLAKDGALDYSSCDPAGGATTVITAPPYCNAACTASTLASACTPPLTALTGSQTKGLVVENASGTVLMDPRTSPTSGAAYVLVSHGPEGGGAYSGDGILLASTTAASTVERKNFANVAYSQPPATGSPTVFLVDDTSNGTTAAHFDDLVSRPGVLALAVKASLGPRSH
ncbi:MAG TPA: prepilin-type N-terminal cleavage/methylation domain-containing protein [Usitatibacter sp.]|nr:prepilin-type N-terminal cleavage/methylation domain-containing protein [Usitatibacter sp.]